MGFFTACVRGFEDIKIVLQYLQHAANPRIASEAANVLLNLCYERKNVHIVVEHGGVPLLLNALESDEQDVQANAAGAIQSLCFQVRLAKTLQCQDSIKPFWLLLL